MPQTEEQRESLSIFEMLGLSLWICAAVIFPFGYWIHVAWYFVALVLTVVGGLCFFSSRIIGKSLGAEPHPDHLGAPVITRELRGFSGSKITTEHEVDPGIEWDTE